MFGDLKLRKVESTLDDFLTSAHLEPSPKVGNEPSGLARENLDSDGTVFETSAPALEKKSSAKLTLGLALAIESQWPIGCKSRGTLDHRVKLTDDAKACLDSLFSRHHLKFEGNALAYDNGNCPRGFDVNRDTEMSRLRRALNATFNQRRQDGRPCLPERFWSPARVH